MAIPPHDPTEPGAGQLPDLDDPAPQSPRWRGFSRLFGAMEWTCVVLFVSIFVFLMVRWLSNG